ncbi:hypothetical protein EVAR_103296_1 [Eumeta japonica]|uniref:Uncharacterized protein n=1 Tax=Eumeta variegata TaxID=151549 RepID=A0A4C1XS95_EUMVA|nr:hypothetical protein EVAR_103296_1 [Eumeta japonica]
MLCIHVQYIGRVKRSVSVFGSVLRAASWPSALSRARRASPRVHNTTKNNPAGAASAACAPARRAACDGWRP